MVNKLKIHHKLDKGINNTKNNLNINQYLQQRKLDDVRNDIVADVDRHRLIGNRIARAAALEVEVVVVDSLPFPEPLASHRLVQRVLTKVVLGGRERTGCGEGEQRDGNDAHINVPNNARGAASHKPCRNGASNKG